MKHNVQRWFLIVCVLATSAFLIGSTADACMCLTRTPGFWGTHPDISAQFLNFDFKNYIPVCGLQISKVDLSACSVIQAVCVNNTDNPDADTQMKQLIRQLTAARLNLRATWSQGGGCTPELEGMVATCNQTCEKIVRGTTAFDKTAVTDCIDELNMFNNMMDTLPDFGPFINPGPANPAVCKAASGDGVTITSCTALD